MTCAASLGATSHASQNGSGAGGCPASGGAVYCSAWITRDNEPSLFE